MVKEYIEREALYRFLTEQLEKETGAYSKGRNAGINIARSAIHNKQITPAADVTLVVYARWKGEGLGDYRCSLCNEIVSGNKYNHCPHCGAKMQGGKGHVL